MSEQEKSGYLWPAALTLLALAIVAGTFFWLSQSSVLAIETIVVDGTVVMTEDEVLAVAEPRLDGHSLLQFSYDDVAGALRELPYIESVAISRDFPHTLVIDVREYRPLARYGDSDGKEYMLSRDGRTLAPSESEAMELPLLKTAEQCDIEIAAYADCEDVVTGVSFIDSIPVNLGQEFVEVRVEDGYISALTATGVEVRFGTLAEAAYKFEVLRQLIARSIAAGEQVTIDVSVPDRPVTRDRTATTPNTATTADGASEQEEAGQDGSVATDAAAAAPEDEAAAPAEGNISPEATGPVDNG